MARRVGYFDKGFTLLELVIVIVLLGIVATISTAFLGTGAQMYAQANDRERLLSQSRFAVERITRELRNAVPNSTRVSDDGRCIEFIPMTSAGRYESLPLLPATAASISFYSAVSDAAAQIAQGHYMTVYPSQPSHLYGLQRSVRLTNVESKTSAVDIAPATTGSKNILYFGSASNPAVAINYGFVASSPSQRFYLWQQAVSYCVEGSELYRYSGYNLTDNQPELQSSFNGAVVKRVLMAQQIKNINGQKAFSYESGVLSRTSVVHMVLVFSSNFADQLFFNQEVHLPNVP